VDGLVNMKAVIAYVPPPVLPYAQAFLNNIRKFRTTHELLLFSDHAWPDVKRIPGNPETLKGEKSFSVSNLVFYTGMELALRVGYSHVLYLEADSRVMGDNWDGAIFDEYFRQPMPAIIGGSVAVHNPCTAGREAALRWEELVANNSRRNYPVATHMHVPVLAFGNKGSNDRQDSCVFCYGSGTVIDCAWYRKLFTEGERAPLAKGPQDHQFGTFGVVSRQPQVALPDGDGFHVTSVAKESRAWDVEIGCRIWEKFGADSYAVIANLPSVFSGYSESITTEAERIAMLRNGERRLIHQCKSGVEI